MITLGIFFLMGILGLVMDVGYGYYLKQVSQAASDSAAMAGVIAAKDAGGSCGTTVLCQTDYVCPSNLTSPATNNFNAACLYARANGARQTVKVSGGLGNSPSNPGAITSYWLTVNTTQNFPLGFGRLLSANNLSVSAQATGGLVTTGGSGGCMWILDPLASASLNAVGTSNVQSNCGIYLNSSSSGAFRAQGGAVVKAASIQVVGGANIANNTTIQPTPTTGVSPAADPLASLPAPTYEGCDFNYLSIGNGTTTLNPGVYCGGLKISGANAIVNFNPGTYIINGGGMQVTSNTATLNGDGVTFFNTSNGYSFGVLAIAGGVAANLTAPSSGPYQGILWYQDRNISSSATNGIGGGASQMLRGTIYMPTGVLSFVGGSNTQSLIMALVAYDLTIAGNAYLQKDMTGQYTGIRQFGAALIQ